MMKNKRIFGALLLLAMHGSWMFHRPVHGQTGSIPDYVRAVHMGGNWGTNVYETVNPSPDYFQFLRSLNADWAGISVALHVSDSMDSTVERTYSGVGIPTFTDEALTKIIQAFQQNGFHVYLTLAFETSDAEKATHPVSRWQMGDPNMPKEDVRILPQYWPWDVSHPDHRQFVKKFWESYSEQAVHFAALAQSEGVELFSLGTETERLFRSRAGGGWPNHFGNELVSLVQNVRKVYGGLLTYDMQYDALVSANFYGPGSDHLWEDLGLDVVGISAYFQLAPLPPDTVTGTKALETSWDGIFKNYLVPLQNRNPARPVVFLEFGYVDDVRAPYSPGAGEFENRVFMDRNANGLDDGQDTQANIYQAWFNVMEKYPGVLRGAFLWGHTMSSEPVWTGSFGKMRGFDVRDKTAETVVRIQYQNWLPGNPVREEHALPLREFALKQNHPNPFNSETRFRFFVKEPCRVLLKVTDLTGREVKTVVDSHYPAGEHAVPFDASNLSSGIYLYRIRLGNFQAVRKMAVMK